MPAPTREVTNEAQRLLLEQKVTLGQLAQAGAVSREAARKWLAGGKPEPAKRKAIAKRFGVPEAAWELAPKGGTKAAATSSPAPAKAKSDGRARPSERPPLDAKSAAQEHMNRIIERRRRLEQNGATAEVFRVLELERRAIVEFARFNGELTAADESRLTETPRFQRVKRTILEALKPYPAALKAVARALDELGP